MNAVINGPTHTAIDGDTIQIPTGTCTWTSGIVINVNITLTGLGATPNSTPSTFGSGTNAVTIRDNLTSGGCPSSVTPLIQINPHYSATHNVTVVQNLNIDPFTTTTCLGPPIMIEGGTSNTIAYPQVRVNNIVFGNAARWSEGGNQYTAVKMMIVDNVVGVVDHTTIPSGSAVQLYSAHMSSYQGVGQYGDNSWAQADTMGTATAWFSENNVQFGDTPTLGGNVLSDCTESGVSYQEAGGCRVVDRFNHITQNGGFAITGGHGTDTSGRPRSIRHAETYGNTLTCVGSSSCQTAAGSWRGGTGVAFGNSTVAQAGSGFNQINTFSVYRSSTNYPPWGTGLCPNVWDITGPPVICLDQGGRGAGLLVTGLTPVLVSTGNPGSVNEVLDPVYTWDNALTGGTVATDTDLANAPTLQANRDFYTDGALGIPHVQTSATAPFNGTTTCNAGAGNYSCGMGFGTLARRPTTCATGVGYWSTDQGSWNSSGNGFGQGVLYKCTSTNSWTGIYTPYSYPHPLTGGGITFNLTVTTSGAPGSVTGTNSSSGSYASGTTIGPLTAVPATGSTFTGWSVTGSALCSGTTNPCASFSLTANSTVVAAFALITSTLSTATAGTGSGTVSCSPSGSGIAYGTFYSCTVTPAGGSTITSVSGCGVSGTFPYNGSMPASNCTVTGTFQGTAATPTFSPSPGTYAGTQSVTLTTATSGATIYYTTNGTTPTTGSTVYSGPISVATTQTVKAIAAKTGWTNSAVASGLYTINGTLATPIFSPPGGTYTSTQVVSIASSPAMATFSGTEGSNANASNGSAPSRNAYTNCAESYSGGQLQPAGFPLGQTACTSADRTAIIGAGGPTLTATTSTITGTGTHALQNGRGAGGTDSLTNVTATYGGASAGDCSGAPTNATLAPNISFPSTVNSAEVFSGTTDGTNFNTSLLAPTKFSTVGTDAANLYVMRTCVTIPTTTGTGFHYESEPNHTLSTGDYFGFGGHYNFTTSKWYYAPQGQPFLAMNLVESDGTVHTTLPFPAGHHMYFEDYFYRTAACTSSSGSNCMFYTAKCVKDFTAGGSLTCYSLVDAVSGLTPGGIPINQPTYPEEINTQTQADFNQASITRAINLDFKSIVAYTGPIIYYTTDGSTPTTSSAVYTVPITVSANTTIKAIAVQAGYVTSAVGTAVYVIVPPVTLSFTATNGSISGTNCANGTLASGTVIGPCTATPNTGYSFTGWSGTGSASGCSGTGTCGFTITANSTVTAAFTINSYTLSTATAGSGTGTITGCSGAHNYAASYSCTVTATGGSTLASVSGCGGSGTTTYTGTMPASSCTVTATFNPPAPTVNVLLANAKLSGNVVMK